MQPIEAGGANWNYLRVRGEYGFTPGDTDNRGELPPRARRILTCSHGWVRSEGTTSACAENTRCRSLRSGRPGNYLRVRGEYPPWFRVKKDTPELPPRARRIRTPSKNHTWEIGTTSACAENTLAGSRGKSSYRNYLRVRGEYKVHHLLDRLTMELPPRARRIPRDHYHFGGGYGTTSACAENT